MNHSLYAACQRYVQICNDLASVNEAIADYASNMRSEREERDAARRLHTSAPERHTNTMDYTLLLKKRDTIEMLAREAELEVMYVSLSLGCS